MNTDVVVIGGGPGGYVAAIRAAQLGLSTVCVEMDRTLGGTCVNVGCIPSKALLDSSHHFEFMGHDAKTHGIALADLKIDVATMLKRKDDVVGQNTKGLEFLFRKNKITWAKGRGTLKSGNVVDVAGSDGTTTSYQAKHVIIATGSVPVELPFLKFDEQRILSNVGALIISAVPKHLIVIGGGVIGLELGSVWRRLGAKVTVVELLPAILPGMDDDIVREADRVFRKQGLDIRTGTKVTGGGRTGDGVFVTTARASGSTATTCSLRSGGSRRSPGSMPRRSASPSAHAARSSSTPSSGRTCLTSSRSGTVFPGRCSPTRLRRKASSRLK